MHACMWAGGRAGRWPRVCVWPKHFSCAHLHVRNQVPIHIRNKCDGTHSLDSICCHLGRTMHPHAHMRKRSHVCAQTHTRNIGCACMHKDMPYYGRAGCRHAEAAARRCGPLLSLQVMRLGVALHGSAGLFPMQNSSSAWCIYCITLSLSFFFKNASHGKPESN